MADDTDTTDSTIPYHITRKFEEIDGRLDALEAVAPASDEEAVDPSSGPSFMESTEEEST
jgi:hypothetical protein